MPKKDRDAFIINVEDNVAANSTNNFNYTPTAPSGEVWEIQRVVFADEGINDGLSSFYRVDFGTGANRKKIMQAHLTGNTLNARLQSEIKGDGSKKIRITRTNNSSSAKQMIATVWVIKKL